MILGKGYGKEEVERVERESRNVGAKKKRRENKYTFLMEVDDCGNSEAKCDVIIEIIYLFNLSLCVLLLLIKDK